MATVTINSGVTANRDTLNCNIFSILETFDVPGVRRMSIGTRSHEFYIKPKNREKKIGRDNSSELSRPKFRINAL